MIRSNHYVRRMGVVLVAMLACALLAPVGASAQTVSPTDEQYEQGVLGVASGNTNDPGSTGSSSSSQLPFTGLDVAAIAVIGIGLVGAGFAIRRAARAGEDRIA
jgi:hypothetical protein